MWTYPHFDNPADAAFVAPPALNAAGDVLYIGSVVGRLLAIAATGDNAGELLEYESDSGDRTFLGSSEPFAITTAPLVATRDDIDAVFVGAANGNLLGIGGDGETLEQIWPNILDSAVGTSPTISDNGSLYAGSLNSGVFATCPNGVTRYGLANGPTLSTPALGRMGEIEATDEILYFGADDGLLRAVREDGILQWSFGFSAPILAAPIVLLADDELASTAAVLAVDSRGLVVRLDAEGRAEADFESPDGLGRVLASPAFAEVGPDDGRLYVASLDDGLHAIDAETGELRWTWAPGAGIESAPAVVLSATGDAAPIVVVGANDGRLYYVRDEGDEPVLVASFDTGSGLPITSSPAVGTDGTTYFGGLDGRVYAVR